MKKSLLGVALLFLVLAAHGTAQADTVIFTDFVKFKGSPSFTPILTATITDIGADTVEIKMEATSLPGSEKITEWYFNIDGAMTTLPSHISGEMADSVTADPDNLKADGDGFFDLLFEFPTSGDVFEDSEESVWTLSFTGLSATDFLSESTPGGLAGAMFFSAVFLGNAYWAPSTVNGEPVDVTPIPEPSTLLLLGSGLLAGGVFRKRFQ